jgi:subtilisin family serine protease
MLEAQLDISRKAVRADPLHNGTGLASPLTGTGVLFGCIDGGFDWTHPDFSTATGTRIRVLWDQGDESTTSASPPAEYGYGREYSAASIDAGLCRETDVSSGHGTHVASIGCGNGRANSAYTGIAPAADIALVKNGRAAASSFEGDLVDACDFLFRRATARQEPCVVNISMGTMMGAHDGTSLTEQGLDKLTGPGKIIVMSAGNHSYYPQHLRYTTGGDAAEPRITFFRTYDSPWLQIDIWYRGGPVNVGIAAYDPYPSLRRVSGLVAAGTQRTGIDLMAGMASITNVASDPVNGLGHATVTIQQYPAGLVLPQMLFALYTSGSGTLDAWIWHGLFGETRSDADHIIPGDRECSIAVPATGHNVISVASHVTKTSWVDVTGATQMQEGDPVLNALSGFSSRGPTRDGRFAPDLSAPGEAIVAALSKDAQVEQRSVLFGGWYRKYQGTSMAAPHVAGTVALMLERNPSLDVAAVRDALRGTATRDAFTGTAPNLRYGYGKLDAYSAVLAVPPKKEPGAALPLSVTLSAFPNPSATDATLTWTQPGDGAISLRMYDALGREIADLAHGANEAGTHQIAVSMSALPPGVYFCRISTQSGAATARLLRTAW